MSDDVRLNILDSPIILEGIGKGSLELKYWVNLKLDKEICFNFFIAPDDVNAAEDGILGCDFFEQFNAILKYKDNTLCIGNSVFKLNVRLESILNVRENIAISVDHTKPEENPIESSEGTKKKSCLFSRRKNLAKNSYAYDQNESDFNKINSDRASDVSSLQSRKKAEKIIDTRSVGFDKISSKFSRNLQQKRSLRRSSAVSSDESTDDSEGTLSSDSAQGCESGTENESQISSEVESDNSFHKKSAKNCENVKQRNSLKYESTHSDSEIERDISIWSATESGNGSAEIGIECESDFDSYEASDKESDDDFSDAKSDCGLVHANEVCTRKFSLPRKSVKYIKIDVDRNGKGHVPEIIFTKEIFSMGGVVDAINKQASIPIVNLSDEEILINIPKKDLKLWNETKNESNNNSSIFKKILDKLEKVKQEFNFDHSNDEDKNAFFNEFKEFFDFLNLSCDDSGVNSECKNEDHQGTQLPQGLGNFHF